MNSYQEEEARWWRYFVTGNGWRDSVIGDEPFVPTTFEDFRRAGYGRVITKQPGLDKEKGIGIDVGSGIHSMLEYSNAKHIVGVDPLYDEYNKIYSMANKEKITYKRSSDEEGIPCESDYFDFAVCNNVIDHTPDPDKLISEIHRVLKKGGKLYFYVHFASALSPAHYILWTRDTVMEKFKDFELIEETSEWFDRWQQTGYYATFKK